MGQITKIFPPMQVVGCLHLICHWPGTRRAETGWLVMDRGSSKRLALQEDRFKDRLPYPWICQMQNTARGDLNFKIDISFTFLGSGTDGVG